MRISGESVFLCPPPEIVLRLPTQLIIRRRRGTCFFFFWGTRNKDATCYCCCWWWWCFRWLTFNAHLTNFVLNCWQLREIAKTNREQALLVLPPANTTCHVAVNLLAISWSTRPNYNNTHDMTAKFSLKSACTRKHNASCNGVLGSEALSLGGGSSCLVDTQSRKGSTIPTHPHSGTQPLTWNFRGGYAKIVICRSFKGFAAEPVVPLLQQISGVGSADPGAVGGQPQPDGRWPFSISISHYPNPLATQTEKFWFHSDIKHIPLNMNKSISIVLNIFNISSSYNLNDIFCLCTRSFFWFVFHITALTVLIAFLWGTYTKEQKALVTTMYHPMYPIWKVEFPAISVCSLNRISQRAAWQYAHNLWV